MTAEPSNTAAWQAELKRQVRGDCFRDPVRRGVYATDASLFQVMPQCVVVPADEGDLLVTLEVAARFGVPITPRGGGTSLSGQTFGPGIVVDTSKSLDAILQIDEDASTVRVQSGVVRDRLNAALAPRGLHFAPDPATGSRATIGGMVGNNTCGTRSVIYGKTIDHVVGCRVLLADGTICEFRDREPQFWQEPSAAKTPAEHREADLLHKLDSVIGERREAILERYPRVLRRVSGYNLDEFVDGAGYIGEVGPRGERNRGHRPWNLSNLIVGSEGTLGILLDATLRLTPLPAATALCVVHFDDLLDSLRGVDAMLEHRPAAVELLDRTVIDEARVNPATAHMAHFFVGQPAAVQIVEFFGSSAEEAADRAAAFAAAMLREGWGYAHPVLTHPASIRDVWETRKLGLGLISNVPGPIKGRDFIEDACVPTRYLADYIAKIQTLCRSEGIDRLSIYAHASVGVVHVVPALDLHDAAAADAMQRIAKQAFEWVMEYGGSWSGEHGDGQLRGQFLPAMFGPQVYDAFRQVKRLFDPNNLMNPGKIIDTATLADNLRYQTPGYAENARKTAAAALYGYRDQGGLPLAVEQCNGVGACRKIGAGTMCPSYMATRDEHHSTRGRANALRLAMSGQLGRDPIAALASDGIDDVLSLCLACKACKSECPNRVDMAKMKSEVLQMRHDRIGAPLSAKLLGRMPDAAARLAGRSARVANLASLIPGGRRVLQRLTGIDSRRPLPAFSAVTLDGLLRDRPVKPGRRDRGRVILFDDTYANFFEPNIGRAAVSLLESLGFEPVLARAGCCQRTRLSQGLVREAKELGGATIAKLDTFARQGLPIVCLEPSCASSLVDDLADLVDDREAASRVSSRVFMLDAFLESQGVQLGSKSKDVLLHGHCHQKAVFGTDAIHKHFSRMDGVMYREVDSGCCGMAGAFGYQHFDLSKQIGEQRLFPAVRAAAAAGSTIVACGISCRHQISDFCGVKALHWVEVVHAAE